MSKGLKGTAALGALMIGMLAMNAGAIAQTAGHDGDAHGQPIAEWHVGSEGTAPVTFNLPRQGAGDYSEVVREQNRPTSYAAQPQAKPKNGARSGN